MFGPRYGVTPYVTQWNLKIQKALPGKVVVDLGYMANHSVKLYDSGLVRMPCGRSRKFARTIRGVPPVRLKAWAAINR